MPRDISRPTLSRPPATPAWKHAAPNFESSEVPARQISGSSSSCSGGRAGHWDIAVVRPRGGRVPKVASFSNIFAYQYKPYGFLQGSNRSGRQIPAAATRRSSGGWWDKGRGITPVTPWHKCHREGNFRRCGPMRRGIAAVSSPGPQASRKYTRAAERFFSCEVGHTIAKKRPSEYGP